MMVESSQSQKQHYFPTVEMKHYNFMIDRRNLFHQLIKNDFKTYDNIRKIATGQGDDYTAGCLLDYSYFKSYYKLIAIDLSKDSKNINREEGATMFFIIEAKETVLDFSK